MAVIGLKFSDRQALHPLPGKVTPGPARLQVFDSKIESTDAESYLIPYVESQGYPGADQPDEQ
jgi:hypothetical protein